LNDKPPSGGFVVCGRATSAKPAITPRGIDDRIKSENARSGRVYGLANQALLQDEQIQF
jgi:hypothetical protein